MDDFDEGPYDVLTGHGGGRWQLIDVRPEDVRENSPVKNTSVALPVDQLVAGTPLLYTLDASLAVFGQSFDDTEQAVEELRRRGYTEVLALSGDRCGGYAWLVQAGLA